MLMKFKEFFITTIRNKSIVKLFILEKKRVDIILFSQHDQLFINFPELLDPPFSDLLCSDTGSVAFQKAFQIIKITNLFSCDPGNDSTPSWDDSQKPFTFKLSESLPYGGTT